MKKFILLNLLFINVATAGLTYKHLVYVCKNNEGVEFHVLRKGADQPLDKRVLAYNMGSWSDYGAWCGWGIFGSKENNRIIKLHEREIIAEDPSSCDFKLNKKKLTAVVEYKLWQGYVGIGSPIMKNKAKLKCEVRDEIVDY